MSPTSPRRWRSPLEQPPPPSVYEIDDGREGGYSYGDMADAAGRGARSRGPVAADPAARHGRPSPG